MEEKKTIFDYMFQTMTVFGYTVLMLNIFCLLFGESAKDFSAIFQYGGMGIPVKIVFQFLCVSILITFFRFVFFTDVIIRNMSLIWRTVCMLTAVVITIACFIISFRWFPVNMWQPWAMFILSFGLSFLGSLLTMALKEKLENKRMEEALRRIKEEKDL